MASNLTLVCLLVFLQITGCLAQSVPQWEIAVLTLCSVTIFIFILIFLLAFVCKCCRKCKRTTQGTIGLYTQHGCGQ